MAYLLSILHLEFHMRSKFFPKFHGNINQCWNTSIMSIKSRNIGNLLIILAKKNSLFCRNNWDFPTSFNWNIWRTVSSNFTRRKSIAHSRLCHHYKVDSQRTENKEGVIYMALYLIWLYNKLKKNNFPRLNFFKFHINTSFKSFGILWLQSSECLHLCSSLIRLFSSW